MQLFKVIWRSPDFYVNQEDGQYLTRFRARVVIAVDYRHHDIHPALVGFMATSNDGETIGHELHSCENIVKAWWIAQLLMEVKVFTKKTIPTVIGYTWPEAGEYVCYELGLSPDEAIARLRQLVDAYPPNDSIQERWRFASSSGAILSMQMYTGSQPIWELLP